MTKPIFYHRFERKNNFFDDFQKSFTRAKEAYLLTCFFDRWGFRVVEEFVKREKKLNLKLLVELRGTKNDALEKVYNLMNKTKGRFQVRYHKGEMLFHPKLYFFENAGQNIVFLGSSNLTEAGFSKNIETNIRLAGKLTEFERFCNDRWGNASKLKRGDVENLKKSSEKNKLSEPAKPTDKYWKKIEDSKDIPPRWKQSDYGVPKKSFPIKKHKKKPKRPMSHDEFMWKLWKKLPSSFRRRFYEPKFFRGSEDAYISEKTTKKWNEFNYSFWFYKYKGGRVVVSVRVKPSKHPKSKMRPLGRVSKLCDYLERTQKDFRMLTDGARVKVSWLVHSSKNQRKFTFKKEWTFTSKSRFSTLLKKIKTFNKKNNHRAVIYVQIKTVDNVAKVKAALENLSPVYEFIKKGMYGGVGAKRG